MNIVFLPRSPYLHDFWPVFWMLYSPPNTALLLVLLQQSGVMATFGCVAQKAASGAQDVLCGSENL
jgi:hypothetical protein